MITAQPAAQTYAVAGDTVVSIAASGTLPLSYRWRRNGLIFTNQILYTHLSVLTISNVQPSNAAIFSISITNLAAATNALSFTAQLIVQADADLDHMADVWELANGLSTNNAADALLDFDGDGVSNYEEFKAGTDPRDPSSFLRVERLTPFLSGGAALEFGAGSNRSYSVEYTDLGGLSWLNLTNVFGRTTNWKATVMDPTPAPGRFYRLVTPFQPR